MRLKGHYIVDIRSIHKIRYFDLKFDTVRQAKDIIDAYLGEGYTVVSIVTIKQYQATPYRHTPFSKFLPAELRKNNPGRTRKRKRLKGSGIRTHKFKIKWEEMPTGKKERNKEFNKDRTVIRTLLLK